MWHGLLHSTIPLLPSVIITSIQADCHYLFPELIPIQSSPSDPTHVYFINSMSCTTSHSNLSQPHPTMHHGSTSLHCTRELEPWSESNPTALGMWRPSKVMWPSHDDCATMHHLSHCISRPPSKWTWDLRVPTLFLFHIFPSYCMLMPL